MILNVWTVFGRKTNDKTMQLTIIQKKTDTERGHLSSLILLISLFID